MLKRMGKLMFLTIIMALLMGLAFGCGSSETGQSAKQQENANEETSEETTGETTVESESKDQAVSDSEEQVELQFTWWGSQDRHDRTLEIIKLYEEQNPNIKIKPNFLGWSGYWEKLATQAAGQNLPDLIQMSYAYLGEYTDRNLLVNLDSYVESGVLDFENVADVYLSGGKVGQELYAVNIGSNSFCIIYDPAMFEKAGVPVPKAGYTYEDLEKMVRELDENLGEDVYGVKTLNDYNGFVTYLRQHGDEMFNEEGTGLGYEDDQIAIDFFSYWDQLLEDGVSTPPQVEASVQGLEDELIIHQKVPMFGSHSNQLVALMSAAGRPLEMTVYPTLPGGEKGHFIAAQYISVSAHSKHPKEAAKFIDFMTNNLEANEILAAERGVPLSSKVREYLYPKVDEGTQATFDYFKLVEEYSRSVNLVEPAGSGAVRKLYERVREGLNYGKMTPEEAAAKFREEATVILEKNKQ